MDQLSVPRSVPVTIGRREARTFADKTNAEMAEAFTSTLAHFVRADFLWVIMGERRGGQEAGRTAALVSTIPPVHDGPSPGVVPDYVVRHIMRYVLLLVGAGLNPEEVRYDDPPRTKVSNGRRCKVPVFDPTSGSATWRQHKLQRNGRWRLPCSACPGGSALTYCRAFMDFFPMDLMDGVMDYGVVRGVAVTEGLHHFSVFPYAAIKMGNAWLDVCPDMSRMEAADFVTFIPTPEDIDLHTLFILKAENRCSLCGAEKVAVQCPLKCDCARYCSEACLKAHAQRHAAFCTPARHPITKLPLPADFAIPVSRDTYKFSPQR